MKKIIAAFLLFGIVPLLFAQSEDHPKREFRGAWIASVANLDWPSSPNLSVEQQKSSLIELLDNLKETNINIVVFQIRPECDALYESEYEPWSYWLTGTQGQAPSPYYDPLSFALKEAHKRGMELHAWFNPYRAVKTEGSYTISGEHVSKENPEWVLDFGSLKMLNPGIPAVRDYVTKVVMDVVNRYDVDGVHFDDYFYPYPPNTIDDEDEATFDEYGDGYDDIGDWRRDNINKQMIQINDSIKAVKPHVKFGVSPFGIWKSGTPPGIVGMNAYSTIYADALAWLEDQSVDYLSPQLYWPFWGGQDYGDLLPWWSEKARESDRHLYPGQALYRAQDWGTHEIPKQIRLNRDTEGCYGSIFFRARNIEGNPKGVTDSLKNRYYKHDALLPVMDWKDTLAPPAIDNLRFERLASTGVAGLQWDLPQDSTDVKRYAIYKFDNENVQSSDLGNAENLDDVTGMQFPAPEVSGDGEGNLYYVVTALDRNYNESEMSTVVEVTPPQAPMLASPADNADEVRDTSNFAWNYAPHSVEYNLEISEAEGFDSLEVKESKIGDTTYAVTGLEGQQKYYWRVNAANPAGISDYSAPKSFTTAFPATPKLIYPQHEMLEVPVDTIFVWNSTEAAETYRFQLSRSMTFTESTILLDTAGITGTTFQLDEALEEETIYWWRITASNEFGTGLWSEIYGFQTETITLVADNEDIPTEYKLAQNYPNPFNPTTTISFAVPERNRTTLKVYDMLGREIRELVDKELSPGTYEVEFDASDVSSGMYIYVLTSGEKRFSKKMMLLK
jgi:uncharacterized lipoprotein YddW (UPF0748 family)